MTEMYVNAKHRAGGVAVCCRQYLNRALSKYTGILAWAYLL